MFIVTDFRIVRANLQKHLKDPGVDERIILK
jgi:hypothetical protein